MLKKDASDLQLEAIASPTVTSTSVSEDEEQIKREDDLILQKMGYKQELFRGFNSFMSFAFCFTAVNVVSSLSLEYSYALSTGGLSSLVWSWVIASFFTIIVGASMAEICSTFPSAGSVYHWTGQLTPPEYAPIISYICGWFNFMGNAAGDASFAYGFAQAVATAGVWTDNNYWTVGQQVALAISLCFVVSIFNALRVDQQGWINNFATFWHIASTIAVIIVLFVVNQSQASASDVFTSTYNGTGFSDINYVYFVGLLSACFAFSGYEAGAHMAEETVNASRSSPWGLVATCITSSIVGFVYIMALTFATPDIGSILGFDANGNPTQYGDPNAAIDVYISACGITGGLALAGILIVLMFFATMSSLTVTSRIGFAMCRDRAFPFSDYLSPVNSYTKTPLRSVALCFILDALFLLLPLVNYNDAVPIAFYAITGITTIGYQVSYAIPILCRITFARNTFPRARFHLGRWSIIAGAISCIWLFGTSIIMFWPQTSPTTQQSMNYSCVVVGGFAVIATVNWFLSARFHYKGPQRGKNDQVPMTPSFAGEEAN